MQNTFSWAAAHPLVRTVLNSLRHDEACTGMRPRHPLIAYSNVFTSIMFFWLAGTTSEPGMQVFIVTVGVLFGVSALYHWKRYNDTLCRIDQSAILALVINTAFPYVYTTRWALAVLMLTAVWGLVLKWQYSETREQSNRNFLIVGMIAFGLYWITFSNVPGHNVALFSLGVLLHVTHLAVYNWKWCDWLPELFGHREVQHVLIAAAVSVHAAV